MGGALLEEHKFASVVISSFVLVVVFGNATTRTTIMWSSLATPILESTAQQ